MRIVSFIRAGAASFGLHTEAGIVDAQRRLGFPDLASLIAGDGLDRLVAIGSEPPDWDHDGIEFLPVVPNAPRVFCVGANYFEHMQEAGREPPEKPWIFLRNNASFSGHRQPIVRPAQSDSFDWEVEFCAVIGSPGRRVDPDDALRHVFGYTVFNDGSVREFQRHSPLWIQGKNFDRSGSVGPWIVPANEVDPSFELRMRSRLNGETMQDDVVNRWHFSLQDVIAYISLWTALQPGDLVAMGTPSGVGFARQPPVFMQPGDTIEVEIESIGKLTNPVVAE